MNKKMFTKLFALVLAVCAVFSLAIIVSSAADTTAYFAVPDGATAPEAISGTTVTMPAAPGGTVSEGYTFVGWTTESVEDEKSAPSYYEAGETVEIDANTVFYALYSKTTESSSAGYTKVTDVNDLAVGDKVVLFASCSKGTFVAGNVSSTYLSSVSASESALPSTGVVFTLGKSGTNWTFTNSSGKLLGATAVKKVAFGSGTTTWTISIDNGNATIQSTTSSYGRFLYNVSSPRFTTYTSNTSSTMVLPMIYKEAPSSVTVYSTLGASFDLCDHSTTEVVPGYGATCTDPGLTDGVICSNCGTVITEQTVIEATGHTYTEEVTTPATCTQEGEKTFTCACGDTKTEKIAMTAHVYEDGVCTGCCKDEPVATFDFGANGTNTEHVDGSTISAPKTYTVSGYNLNITAANKLYGTAYDLMHNSGLKFGTSSVAGSMTFTVDADVVSVIIYAAGYKSNPASVTINGTTYTLNGRSDKGTYDAITVDTSATKTVTFEVSSGNRAMINTIEYYIASGAAVCEHTNTSEEIVKPTCYKEGTKTVICDDCGKTVSTEPVAPAHTFEDGVCSVCSVVEAPKTGVAYKFGMYQSVEDTIYYIDGEMSGFYMATVTNASTGIYVYLEEATGGYYMYTYLKGVKTYINMVVSGTYVNAKYQTEASTVYTYNADKLAIIANVNGSNYYFGTYNTYTTVGTTYNANDHICRFYATEQPAAPKFDTASVKLGTDLAMIYTVTVPAGAPTMTIEFNGKTVTIEKFTAVDNDTFTFTFDGIGPQQMALNIKATLNVNGEAVATFDNYSVEKNLNNIKNTEGASAELVALVNSVLIYGDASENYVGFEGGVDASALENNVAANDATYTLANAETFGFTAAGVNFDAANKIYVKFYVEGEFTLTVNGTAVAVEAAEDGNYKVYTDALTATQFAYTYTFVITVGEETATLTYSVNAYAAAMQNDAEMGALAAALYAYGVNAKAYAA